MRTDGGGDGLLEGARPRQRALAAQPGRDHRITGRADVRKPVTPREVLPATLRPKC
ncbi:hypothetical protein [uncultured Amaricoccus sp.]|uniref:hypothetical protein n=1 Tax=uncultured Amaricoccus sp. TaxID=339341 RepID=UPI0026201A1D|nr:hypothetical protein [uncultured Amaricoccus sp.]